MIPLLPFLIPDRGLGEIRSIPAERVDAKVLARHLATSSSNTADLAVILTREAGGAGYEVHFKQHRIGTLPAAAAPYVEELDAITQTGCSPLATARVTQTAISPAVIELHILLPEPGLLIPANAEPEGLCKLLEPGPEVRVAYLPTAPHAAVPYPQHYLATLGFDAAGEVSVCIDGIVVGYLDDGAGALLAPSLRSLERQGITAVVRAFHDPSGPVPVLTIHAAPVACGHVGVAYPLPSMGRLGLRGGVDKQKSARLTLRRR